ncbi:hypothetical protein CASFOL_022150 [Castilleja foliolosa]|uniref:F-box domain-containing protein n=1 Tax=Castilleja foliolosa TaxID=1961234 RepID=A0ABD3D243_9LAMI
MDKQQQLAERDDRISELPQPLLHHILTFLPKTTPSKPLSYPNHGATFGLQALKSSFSRSSSMETTKHSSPFWTTLYKGT